MVTLAIAALTWENETSRRGAGNTATALTYQSDLSGRQAGVSLPSTNTPRSDKRTGRGDRRPVGECAVAGCDGPKRLQARGLCGKHYHRLQRNGDALALRRSPRPEGCAVEGCGQPNYCREWCVAHYNRWLHNGDPLVRQWQPRSGICEAPECKKRAGHNAYCPMHRQRLRMHGTLDLPERELRYVHSHGYIVVKIDGHPLAQQSSGWVYEHRAVLLDKIGPGAHPCHWCGTEVTWARTYPEYADGLVVDHLDDSCDNNVPENLVPSCALCNLGRGIKKRWGNVR